MIRFLSAAALLALALPAGASTIVPPQPTAQQAVELRLLVDSCSFNPATVQVAASGSTLRLTQRLNNCLAPGAVRLYDVRLGNFPAGDYRVEVYNTPAATGTPAESLAFTVTDRVEIAVVPPPVHPLTNYSGFWWNPDQPGWGLALTQTAGSDALFGAMYVYGADGIPMWSTIEGGTWTTPTSWSGISPTMRGPLGHVTVSSSAPITLDFGAIPTGGRLNVTVILGGSNPTSYPLTRFVP